MRQTILICDNCGKRIYGTFYSALCRQAKTKGWRVKDTKDGKLNICPDCAKNLTEAKSRIAPYKAMIELIKALERTPNLTSNLTIDKLRHQLLMREEEVEGLVPGLYVVTKDGWDGPYQSYRRVEEVGAGSAEEGNFTALVEVKRTLEGAQRDENEGIYAPTTLHK